MFEIDKEIIIFKTIDELSQKAKILLDNPKYVQQLATAGHKRFMAEHDSKIRLAALIEQIGEL